MTGIIDNTPDNELVDAVRDSMKKSKQAKFAIGYFFLSGFSLVKDDFPEKFDNFPFLKIIMGDETTFPTKQELVEGFNLREFFKQKMIEELQKKKQSLTEKEDYQLRTLKDLVAQSIIDVKLYEKSRLHAKLYLFLTNQEEKYASPGLAVVGSSNLTAEGLTRNKELNVSLTSRDDVLYLDRWFDELWDDAIEFREDLLKVIDYSGVLPESKYPDIGEMVASNTLFKYLVFKWFEGRVLNLIKRDILMEFQLVGVENAVKVINFYNGSILADSVGLGKSFMASAIIEEFLNGKHPSWSPEGTLPSVLLILPPSIIYQWEELLIHSDDYFLKYNDSRLIKDQNNYKVYEIYDSSGKLGKIGFLSLGIFQKMKEAEIKNLAEKYDLFVIDEAHRYRNKNTKRWHNTTRLQKKKDGFHNKFMLLTATPLNNSINDIFNLIRLFNDDTFAPFRLKGIPIDEMVKEYSGLKKKLEQKDDGKIRKDLKEKAAAIKQNVLDEIMVLRTRKYIQEQFKDLKIDGKKIVFKDPKPYSLEYSSFYASSYGGLIKHISQKLEKINFEYTKLYGSRYVVFEGDEEEEEEFRYIEIADLFKLLLGKRIESGIFAFETTIKRIYEKEKIFYNLFSQEMNQILDRDDLIQTIEKAIEKARIEKDLEEINQEYSNMEEEKEETWFDRVVKILLEYADESEHVAQSDIEILKIGLNKVIENLKNDLDAIGEIIENLDSLKEKKNGEYVTLDKIPKQEEDIIDLSIFKYSKDSKLEALKQLIGNPAYKSEKLQDIPTLNGKKIVVFTQFKDTAYYLHHNLVEWVKREPSLHTWLKSQKLDRIKIGLVTGETDTSTKMNYLKRFAPQANDGWDEVERYGEIEILVTTDSLSEGVNLQDADAVINYDLPWNPMMIVQRVGRVNRIGNEKDVIVINNIPSEEIEIIVGILNKLQQKIDDITLVVGKETKILSPEEEIKVETFGEKIKDYSSRTMVDLEEYSVSEDFKLLPEGIPQEQIDEYKLLNFVQFERGLTADDFDDVLDMKNPPYYCYINSDREKIIGIHEFFRGKFPIMKRVYTCDPESGTIDKETPLIFKDLIKRREKNPEKIENAIENLKQINDRAEDKKEELREKYQLEQRGFLYNLYNELLINREKASEFRGKYINVMNVLQTLSFYLYTREIKPLLLEKNLIEMNRDKVEIKDFEGVVDTLSDFFNERGLTIESLEVRSNHIGWYYET